MMSVAKLLDERGVYYRPKGRDFLVHCFNPEHPDSSPSMRIDKNSGLFNCLSCGFHGNIYHYFGVELPRSYKQMNDVLSKIDKMLTVFRPMQIPESAVPFDQSYRGISAETYLRHNAFTDSAYQGFVMFPITDSKKRIVMLQGRRLHSDMTPKYVFYPQRTSPPIYPCHRGEKSLVLVEGMFDVLNLEDKGFTVPVSAIFGSAAAKSTILEKLRVNIASGLKNVILLLDNDEAGLSSARDLKESLKKELNVIILNKVLGDDDPGSLDRKQVAELNSIVLAEISNLLI